MAHLSLSFLGPFQAALDGRLIKGFESNKVRALLAYLAVEADRPHAREWLAGLLWPNFLNRSAVNNLRSVLANLRQVLGELSSDSHFLIITRDTIQFDPATDCDLDVDIFVKAVASPIRQPDLILATYRGDFLEGFSLPDNSTFEEWLQTHRNRLQQQMLAALESLAAYALQQSAYSDAVTYARRQLEMDNLRESAHRQLMLANAHLGQRAEALAHYEQCSHLLRVELNIEPSAETRLLAKRIAAEELDQLPTDFFRECAPITGIVAPRHNLPLQLSSFIGREREVAEVQRLLGASRLVTLTGPGGCGKSRLSLEVTTGRLPEAPDGTWLVELAPLANSDLVLETITYTIGLRHQSGRPAQEALIDYLRPRNVLLLLDNCEHLVQSCAAVAEALLRACPLLRILATSREALSVPGETLYVVPSLQLPEPDQQPCEMAQVESVRLFVERAAACRPGFELTDSNAVAVAQICRRLDGIPLAIELAAARVKSLSAAQIAERLGDRFQLLTGGSRTALPRQQTLRATIDWSYNLLSEPERRLFCRLAVFRGGWTLEAAEAVCAGPDRSGFENLTGLDILDLLSHLVDKSLVMAKESDGAVRYSRLETIRQYGCQKLEELGELDQLRHRHLDYFLDLAERGDRELSGPHSLEWTRRMEREHNNLQAALELAFSEGGAGDKGMRIILALAGFTGVWSMPYWKEAVFWIEKALEHPDARAGTALRARLLFDYAIFVVSNNWEKHRPLLEESLAVFDALGEPYRVDRAYVLMWLGFRLSYQPEERAKGTRYLREALQIFEMADDKWGQGFALNLLSGVVFDLDNDFTAAWALVERGMEVARQTGEQRLIAILVDDFGIFSVRRGLYSQGQGYLEKALETYRQFHDNGFGCQVLKLLGDAARGLKAYEKAEALYGESLDMVQEIGWISLHAVLCLSLGMTLINRGELGQALSYFNKALDLSREHNLRLTSIFPLDGLAAICAVQNKGDVAARLFGAFDAQVDALLAEGFTRFNLLDAIDDETHEQFLSIARAQLDAAAFAQEWQKGQALTLEEAVQLALATIKE